jgi:predicted ATP-dependent protease
VRIKPGALHRANGGYLLIDAEALLESPATAEALRRALETQEIRFDPPASPVGAVGDEVPDLEPIPLNVCLVVFANAETQRRLLASHSALRRLFKVEAVFEHAVERTKETVDHFARIVAGVVEKQGLRPIDASGVARLVDEAAHRAGAMSKLSLHIADIIDVCREADHWAASVNRKVISAAEVNRALLQRRSPLNGSGLAEAS